MKSKPIALQIIGAVAVITAVIAFVFVFLTVISFLNKAEIGEKYFYAAVISILNAALFSSLYYITKAACLYIDKNSSK